MKIYDFGLWFYQVSDYFMGDKGTWFTNIPDYDAFDIYYDGFFLGHQSAACQLYISKVVPYKINLKNRFRRVEHTHSSFNIKRRLTLDDFDIIPNPEYKGDE
jgi:hypothetical protein